MTQATQADPYQEAIAALMKVPPEERASVVRDMLGRLGDQCSEQVNRIQDVMRDHDYTDSMEMRELAGRREDLVIMRSYLTAAHRSVQPACVWNALLWADPTEIWS